METVNQDNQAIEITGKTFTQAEVDAIVGDRLKRDRQKYADYDALKEKANKFDQMEEASKSELQKAMEQAAALQTELDSIKAANAIRDIRQKIAEETGVPASLITGTTEDECRDQAKGIIDFKQAKAYPVVRDGGEVTERLKATPQQQFAEWLDKT